MYLTQPRLVAYFRDSNYFYLYWNLNFSHFHSLNSLLVTNFHQPHLFCALISNIHIHAQFFVISYIICPHFRTSHWHIQKSSITFWLTDRRSVVLKNTFKVYGIKQHRLMLKCNIMMRIYLLYTVLVINFVTLNVLMEYWKKNVWRV